MIYESLDIGLSPVLASVIFGAVLGAVFGVAGQVSRFCLRRGLVDLAAKDHRALGVWVTALIVALIGTQIATAYGGLDFAAHRFTAPDLPYLAVLLGGILFGVGMVLTRGCISRLTILSGTGNLRALLVIAVFAIVAHATLKGVFASLRVAIGSVTLPVGSASTAAGLPGGAAFWTVVLVAALGLLVLRSKARGRDLALAALIGLLIPLGWIGTGVLLYDEFDPISFETLSFTAPWADTLFWGVASTSIPAGFGTGLVGGVLGGSLLAALARGEFKLVSFESPSQTLRYLGGAGLMGFGGVLAGGCTIGAGLSGVATLSVAAVLALAGMVAGALGANWALSRTPPALGAFGAPAE